MRGTSPDPLKAVRVGRVRTFVPMPEVKAGSAEKQRGIAAHPLPQADPQQLLLDGARFGSHRNVPTHQVQRFRATGRLAVAAYGIAQGPAMVHDIGPASRPWLLNSVCSHLTAQPSPDGTPAPNPAWYEEFRALQRAEDRLPVRTGTVPV